MEAFDREGRGSLRELAAKRIEMCRSDDP